MRVYVVNLDRSPERLARFMRTNSDLGEIVRFSAIDGSGLNIGALARQGLVTDDILKNFTMGAVGCALSHAALWDTAIASGDSVTICEDDVIFNRHFEQYAQEVMSTLPPQWDIVVWAWNFDLFMIFEMLPGVSNCLGQFDQARMRAGIREFQHQAMWPRAYRLSWAFGTPCYTVSAAGAQRLKSRLVPFRPMTIPCPEGIRAKPYMPYYRILGVDGALNTVYRNLSAFVCFPPLAVADNDAAASTVQE